MEDLVKYEEHEEYVTHAHILERWRMRTIGNQTRITCCRINELTWEERKSPCACSLHRFCLVEDYVIVCY